MNDRLRRKDSMLLVFVLGAIPAIILLGNYFGLPGAVTIPLLVIFSFFGGAWAIWCHANQHPEENPWWQDDDASGWRGY